MKFEVLKYKMPAIIKEFFSENPSLKTKKWSSKMGIKIHKLWVIMAHVQYCKTKD